MADEQEILLRNLVTRFSLDEDSVRQVIEGVTQAKSLEKRVIVESEREVMSELAATAEIKKQKKMDELSAIEREVTAHYDRQVNAAQGNADQIKLIMERQAQDLARIKKREQEVAGVTDPDADPAGVSKITTALGGLRNAVSSILPGIGLGFVSTALTAGVMAANIAQAVDRLRAMETAGRGIAFGAGMSGGFAPGLSGSFQTFRQMTEGQFRDPEQISALLSTFSTIQEEPGTAGAGIMTQRGLEAVGLGSAFGVNEQFVAKMMVQMRILDNIPSDQLAQKFTALGNKAFESGMTVADYGTKVLELTGMTKRYGMGVEDSERVVSSFARELQTGIVTIQDLARIQTGLANTGAGTRAFAMRQMLDRGLVSGDLQARLAEVADNPAALEHLGLMIEQNEFGDDMRAQMNQAGVGLARALGRESVPEGVTGQTRKLMEERATMMFAQQLGFTQSTQTLQAQRDLLGAAEGTREAISKGALNADRYYTDSSDAIRTGFKSIEDSVGNVGELLHATLPGIYEGATSEFQRAFGGAEAKGRIASREETRMETTLGLYQSGIINRMEATRQMLNAASMSPEALESMLEARGESMVEMSREERSVLNKRLLRAGIRGGSGGAAERQTELRRSVEVLLRIDRLPPDATVRTVDPQDAGTSIATEENR